ncbi:MAG: hypothetical protein MJ033_07145 [Victivallaceae bacterium]|nr:hypothetical protein [Victivallaceae bacterium]
MKKLLSTSGTVALLCITSLIFADERTVDTDFLATPRTVYTNFKRNTEKKQLSTQGGQSIRDRLSMGGAVIFANGNFGENPDNQVYEIQIGNLKRIDFRASSGAPSLAWATYDANGNVCRLGPQAMVTGNGNVSYGSMPKYEIEFEPREKIFCFSVGKAVRGKMKIRYYSEGSFSIGGTSK